MKRLPPRRLIPAIPGLPYAPVIIIWPPAGVNRARLVWQARYGDV